MDQLRGHVFSLRQHVSIQKKNLLGVFVHSLVGGLLFFVAVWFLYDGLSWLAMVIVSGVFALLVFLVGAISVVSSSVRTLQRIDAKGHRDDTPNR